MWCIKIKKNYQNPGHFYIMCKKIRTGDLYSAEYCYYVYRSTVSRIGFKSSLVQLKCKKTFQEMVYLQSTICLKQPEKRRIK